jgi:hypothetical protein
MTKKFILSNLLIILLEILIGVLLVRLAIHEGNILLYILDFLIFGSAINRFYLKFYKLRKI